MEINTGAKDTKLTRSALFQRTPIKKEQQNMFCGKLGLPMLRKTRHGALIVNWRK